jgi:hypothetical protein
MLPSLLRRDKRNARAGKGRRQQDASPWRFRPRLETLEERELLSVSPSFIDPGAEFIRYNDGQLFLHDSAGFHRIDTNVVSVSRGFTERVTPPIGLTEINAAFIVYSNGQLFEWAQDTGFQFIDSNVVSVLGNSGAADSVFILYNNGQLFRHDGTSPVTGFTFIAGAVTTMSATVEGPSGGLGDVFYVQSNHILSEHLIAGGSVVIDGNVQGVSGSMVLNDSAFVLYTNGALFEFQGSPRSFTPIDTNVASVSAGETSQSFMTLTASAYYVTQSGVLVEWRPPTTDNPDGTYNFLDVNVASVSAQQGRLDDVFIVYNNDMLFEHVGHSRRSGFTFIDSNVSP